jgi:hypothetical protein
MIAPGSEKRDPPNDPKEPPFTPPPEKKPPLALLGPPEKIKTARCEGRPLPCSDSSSSVE